MDPELFKAFCAEYVREVNRVRGDENARGTGGARS
jgi:hypothetical protein